MSKKYRVGGGKMKRLINSPVLRKLLPFIVVFVLGMVSGGIVVDKINNRSKTSTPTNNRTAQQSAADAAQRQNDRLEANYKRSKGDVAKDQKESKLTKEQADKIIQKIEEIYNLRTKELSKLDKEEARKKLTDKRTEIRRWASENKISSRYLIRMLTP